MSDAFLTLAKTSEGPKGLSCFIVPRWIPATGERNTGLIFHRLKEKLGDKSNASSEVEYVASRTLIWACF
jgi:putative acyl-CoA dehydrogenase